MSKNSVYLIRREYTGWDYYVTGFWARVFIFSEWLTKRALRARFELCIGIPASWGADVASLNGRFYGRNWASRLAAWLYRLGMPKVHESIRWYHCLMFPGGPLARLASWATRHKQIRIDTPAERESFYKLTKE